MRLAESYGIKAPRWLANELVKADDINYLHESTYKNILDALSCVMAPAAAGASSSDILVGEGVRFSWSTAMTCILATGVALSFKGRYFTGSTWGWVSEDQSIYGALVGVAANVAFDVGGAAARYDTVEIRPTQTLYDSQSRAFRDPATGTVTTTTMETKVNYGYEVQVLKGTEGAGVAPTHTAGWIKVAEVYVAAGVSTLSAAAVRGVEETNPLWTTEATATVRKRFTLKSLSDFPSMSSQAGKFLQVNATNDGVQFGPTLAGNEGRRMAVNIAASGWDFDPAVVISTQAQFNNVVERVSANVYRFKAAYTSLKFRYLSSGYAMSGVLAGGDTWGRLQTYGVTHLEFETNTRLDFANTQGYLQINTSNFIGKNIIISGTGTVASAIAQSYHLDSSYITLINCRTYTRLSNTVFVGFQGNGNLTNVCIGCSVNTLTSSGNMYGFKDLYNLSACHVYDLESTGGAVSALHTCQNVSDVSVSDLTGVSGSAVNACQNVTSVSITTIASTGGIINGFYRCYGVSNSAVSGITSVGGNAYGFNTCSQVTGCRASDIQAAVNYNSIGFDTCHSISSCQVNELDATGTGVCYGYNSCTGINSSRAYDLDTANGVCRGFNACDLISTCYVYDLDTSASSGVATGYHTCTRISGSRASDIQSYIGNVSQGFYSCTALSACGADYITATGSVAAEGFSYCNDLSGCTASNIANGNTTSRGGFYYCRELTSCRVTGGTSSGSTLYGFAACYGLSGCHATDLSGDYSINGFNNCQFLSACVASSIAATYNARGFSSCHYISSCVATLLTGGSAVFGFDNCDQISSCYTEDITALGGNATGFYSCENVSSCSTGTFTASGTRASFVSCVRVSSCLANYASTSCDYVDIASGPTNRNSCTGTWSS